MKNVSFKKQGMIILFCLVGIYGCDEAKPDCDQAGATQHAVRDVDGSVTFVQEIGLYMINYAVPRSTDSVLSGVVCDNPFSDIELRDGIQVRFTGNFRDDKQTIDDALRGKGNYHDGQEFYYLELSSLELLTNN